MNIDLWAAAGRNAEFAKKAPSKVRRDPGKQYAEALDRHHQMEAELSRALNRWQKSRAALHRIEKKLDILQNHGE
jgi:hypothetical protein